MALVRGTSGRDKLKGTGSKDKILGLSGNDVLLGLSGKDLLVGGNGRDNLKGGSGKDNLKGGKGNDKLNGGSGNDKLNGGKGNDKLKGGSGNDTLIGDKGNDNLKGGSGNDFLEGGIGGDVLDGGTGIDTLSYAASPGGVIALLDINVVLGITPNSHAVGDTISNFENVTGSGVLDVLVGDSGNNQLRGEGGNDVLIGGGGVDTKTGGSGADTFDFNSVSETGIGSGFRDVITDFTQGQDLIDISTIDSATGFPGNQPFEFIGNLPFFLNASVLGEIRFFFDGPNTIVQGEINGDVDEIVDFEIELTGNINLQATDFFGVV